jgi:hypothetical protein
MPFTNTNQLQQHERLNAHNVYHAPGRSLVNAGTFKTVGATASLADRLLHSHAQSGSVVALSRLAFGPGGNMLDRAAVGVLNPPHAASVVRLGMQAQGAHADELRAQVVYVDLPYHAGLQSATQFVQEPAMRVGSLTLSAGQMSVYYPSITRDEGGTLLSALEGATTAGGSFTELFYRCLIVMFDLEFGAAVTGIAILQDKARLMWPRDAGNYGGLIASFARSIRSYHIVGARGPKVVMTDGVAATLWKICRPFMSMAPGDLASSLSRHPDFADRILLFVHGSRSMRNCPAAYNGNAFAIASRDVMATIEWLINTTGDQAGLNCAMNMVAEALPHSHHMTRLTNLQLANNRTLADGQQQIAFGHIASVADLLLYNRGMPADANFLARYNSLLPVANAVVNIGAIPAATAAIAVGSAPAAFAPANSARNDAWQLLEVIVADGRRGVANINFATFTGGELALLIGTLCDPASSDSVLFLDTLGGDEVRLNAGQRSTVCLGLHMHPVSALPASGVFINATYAASSGTMQVLDAMTDRTLCNTPVLEFNANLVVPRSLLASLAVVSVQLRCFADSALSTGVSSDHMLTLYNGLQLAAVGAALTREQSTHLRNVMHAMDPQDPIAVRSMVATLVAATLLGSLSLKPLTESLTLVTECPGWQSAVCYSSVQHQMLIGSLGAVGGLFKDLSSVAIAIQFGRGMFNIDAETGDLSLGDRLHVLASLAGDGRNRLICCYEVAFFDSSYGENANFLIPGPVITVGRVCGTEHSGEIGSTLTHTELLGPFPLRLTAAPGIANPHIRNYMNSTGLQFTRLPRGVKFLHNAAFPDFPGVNTSDHRTDRQGRAAIPRQYVVPGAGFSQRDFLTHISTELHVQSSLTQQTTLQLNGFYDNLIVQASELAKIKLPNGRGTSKGILSVMMALADSEADALSKRRAAEDAALAASAQIAKRDAEARAQASVALQTEATSSLLHDQIAALQAQMAALLAQLPQQQPAADNSK